MAYLHRITIEAWPYWGVKQEDAGERVRKFEVRANHMRHAVEIAEQLAKAIEASPQVWQAPIQSVELMRPLQ